MGNKVAASLAKLGPHFERAGNDGNHIAMGPGQDLELEWRSAGLELPDLDQLREYRLDRVVDQLNQHGYGGIILMDPMNIRYATDTTNMQIWVMHNASRYAWVGADRSVILWEFYECDFFAGHNPNVDEVRPAIGSTYFLAGNRHAEKAKAWATEMASVIAEHASFDSPIAVDQASYLSYKGLEDAGVTVAFGQEVMELARSIKGPDEIKAMRCAVHACEATMAEMHAALKPGMSERELWAMLHAGNIRRGGEWIETQILASGPRTNPWMQEASSRIIEQGDIVGYDTDLVGAYGMMVDISRTWVAGDVNPTSTQRQTFELAVEQIDRNSQLLVPGRSFAELTHESWAPPTADFRHYCVLFHGVGQCDEYPEIFFPEQWDSAGYDGVVEAGMVFTTEAYVGARDGASEGVKLEEQYLVTETGPEKLSTYPLDLVF